MREEKRPITIEQTVYIADDGKEFDDEDDCKSYEINQVCESLKMRNYLGVKTNNIDNCQAVKLNSFVEIQSFIELCAYEGVSYKGISEPGIYLYTEGRYGNGNEAWTNISKIIESFEESEDTVSGN